MSDDPSREDRFDDNDYARPNQPWRCGWADDGRACPLGPTKSGICRSAHECAPYKKGDTWVCARTKANGGACDEGPLPDGICCRTIERCQPKRSVMSRRGIVSFCAFALAVGIAFIMLGSPNRTSLISPGELTSQHRQVVHRCEDCHVQGEGDLGDWIHSSFDNSVAQQQSQLCLKCHRDIGDHALEPHGLSSEMLTSFRGAVDEEERRPSTPASIAAAKNLLPSTAHASLACATCHREHQGTAALTELTNRQCQVCHESAFHSFADGHPTFRQYPAKRRTRIYFDHVSHYGQHFPPEDAKTGGSATHSCSDCHIRDSAGRYMLVRSFDQTCASCHEQQIRDDTTLGLAMLSLPAIDVESLRDKNANIGEWPADYPRHVEATSTPTALTELLLQSSEGFNDLRAKLSALDLNDLREATPEQITHVESFTWALKEMLHDITTGGHPEIERRLATAVGDSIGQRNRAVVVDAMPVELLGELRDRWLPHLQEEIVARRGGAELGEFETTPAADIAQTILDERDKVKRVLSGWYLHDSSLSLRYRPTGHADPLLKALLNASARLGAVADTEVEYTPLTRLYEDLTSPFASGRCIKCHSIERFVDGGMAVQWDSYVPTLEQHGFTDFSHAPHITMLTDEACSHCHTLATSTEPATSLLRSEYVSSSWVPAIESHQFDSNFATMNKSKCAACHAENTARDRCLTCHNYHVR